jgi:predicted permease
MNGPPLKGQRLVALFLLGCLLFNFPLLSLFAGNTRIWGIPLIYLYIFTAWAIIIALMALIIERKDH